MPSACVLFENMRHKIQFAYLARQVYPEYSNGLYETYLDAAHGPHVYRLLDLPHGTNKLLRFRTDIFPSEVAVV